MQRFLSTLLLAASLAWSQPCFASFAYRGTFTVQAAQMGSSQTDFPFAIDWTDNVLKQTGGGGQVTDAQGDDIRPYSNSDCATGALTYQRLFYDGTAGRIYMRVKSTGGVGYTIYLCVGDATVTTDGSSTSTWNANFLGVWDLPNGTSLTATDITANTNDGTLVNTPTATTGKLDGGAALASASSQYITAGTAIDPIAITIMVWAKGTSFPNSYNAVVSQVGDANHFFQLLVKSSGKLFAGVRTSGGGGFVTYDGTGSNTLSTGTFYHLAMTYDSSAGLVGYVNGSSDNTVAADGAINTGGGGTLSFGNDLFNAGRLWNGVLDEIQIMNAVASGNWVAAEANMGNQSTFWGSVTFQSTSGGTTAHRGMLLGVGQ